MHVIDRAALAVTAFLSLFLLYNTHIANARIAAVLAFLCATACTAGFSILGKRHLGKKKARAALSIRTQLQLERLALLSKRRAAEEIDALLQRVYAPGAAQCIDDGILYVDKSAWVSLCLRHPDGSSASYDDFAQAIREQNAHCAKKCVLICLGKCAPIGKTGALSHIRIIDGASLAALYARHPELLPEETAKRKKRFRLQHPFKTAPDQKRTRQHLLYVLFLLPGYILSKSLVLLLCLAFHIAQGLRGLISMQPTQIPTPFDPIWHED